MYRALRAEVADVLERALEAQELPTDDLGIEDPPGGVDATLASSVAFRLAGTLGEAPAAVAAQLSDEIDVSDATYIGAVTNAGPYLNVHASETYYEETLLAGLDPTYGTLPDRDERVVVEHTSANPTGPVHVGRARNPIIGDAIARVLSAAGYEVERHYYVNDAGRQMAVFTWAYETFEEDDLPAPDRAKPDYDLVRYYRAGNDYLESENEQKVAAAETEIEAIMRGLESGDEATYRRVSQVVEPVLEGMRQTLERLPARFDEFVRETRFMRDGSTEDLVQRLKALPNAEQADGAWQLDLAGRGIDKELVFVRSDDTSLYPTRDIAHHEWKLRNFDRAITVLGEDHELQARQLRAALDQLGNDVSRLRAVHYSWVNLPGGEGMSTRRGTGIDLDDLLDEAIDRARQEVEARMDDRLRDDDLDEGDIDRIAHQVGIGAVRYDIVAKQASKAITFEWERALNFEAQSAPYLQYVHARCSGILTEAGREPVGSPDADALTHPTERELLAVMARFPAVIEEAADDLAPHVVATYCRELAETFNAFYRECPVVSSEVSEDTGEARLALVSGAKHTMANALDVLGVEAPESM